MRDEILAEQLAYYATGQRRFRSSYGVPPLAPPGKVGRLMRVVERRPDEY